MTLPTACLDKILRAQKKNLSTISQSAGYLTNVDYVDETDVLIDDSVDPIASATLGTVIIVRDVMTDYEYRTAGDVRGTLSYEIQSTQIVAIDSTSFSGLQTGLATLRGAMRNLEIDIWRCFHADIYLGISNALNGGANERLVTEHRIRNTKRSYAFPSGAMVFSVVCTYDFNAYSTS